MKRIVLLLSISVLAVVILVFVRQAEAQQAGKVYRVGYLRLGAGSPTSSSGYMGFRQGMRELGYVEGQNYVLEYRSAERKRERLPEIAAELVRLKVDVIVTSAGPAIRAAKRATSTIPIVMLGGSALNPVAAGLVASLARPGGNMTGLIKLAGQLHGKRLELLKEVSPRLSRVAILWPGGQQKQAMKEVKAVGQALGIQIQSFLIATRLDQLESAFSAINRDLPHALLVATVRAALNHRARVIDFANKRQLLTIFDQSLFVTAGGLMSYGVDHPALYRRAATYVDKILKGAKPADLPIEQPREFKLVINLKTAKQLGITIPPEVLFRATKVIK